MWKDGLVIASMGGRTPEHSGERRRGRPINGPVSICSNCPDPHPDVGRERVPSPQGEAGMRAERYGQANSLSSRIPLQTFLEPGGQLVAFLSPQGGSAPL